MELTPSPAVVRADWGCYPAPLYAARWARYVVVVLCVAITVTLAAGCSSSDSSARKKDAPNIIHMMADDMRYDEMDRVADLKPGGGFDWMRQHSTTFSKMWMADNLCCPSRTTALTGQTPYNNKVFDNRRFKDLKNTLPMWLHDAGYCTGFSGKYLNHYNATSPRPPGWTYWQPVTSHLELEHGYIMLNRDGKKVSPSGFITDELAAVSRSQISDCLDSGKPTFATYWPFAPHYDSDPAPQYSNAPVPPWTPTDPSFNEADMSDKPEWLQKYRTRPSLVGQREALQRAGDATDTDAAQRRRRRKIVDRSRAVAG